MSDGGRLAGRLIAVGVTGSIAAYKAADLVRRLGDEGADVVVLMTPSATRFVGPLTFAALTRHPVETDVGGLLPDERIGHIVVADSADAIVVAPATAHWLAAMATGLAGDTVTAACLATTAPVVVAPAMDGEMYAHPATRANVARLRDGFGYRIVEPAAGPLASGQVGQGTARRDRRPRRRGGRGGGRHTDPERGRGLAAADRGSRAPGGSRGPAPRRSAPAGRPSRSIPCGSSATARPGRWAWPSRRRQLARGARVTLVVGSVSVPLPSDDGVTIVPAETTAAMGDAVRRAMEGADALIMAAAVADFRPRRAAATKLTRDEGLVLELEPTEDILAGIGAGAATTPAATRPVLVGFAAETGSLERAAAKLGRKGVDLLVANDVAEPGSGFGTDTNRVTILARDGSRDDLPLLSKREVADRILDRVAVALDGRALDARGAAGQTGRLTQESPA